MKNPSTTQDQIGTDGVPPMVHDMRSAEAFSGFRYKALHRFIADGALKTFLVGGKRFVKHEELVAFIDRHERAQEKADAERTTA